MIHFNFTVTAEDAENIFGALQDEICRMHEHITERMASLGPSMQGKYDEDPKIKWFKERIKYIEALKKKMHNTSPALKEYLAHYKKLKSKIDSWQDTPEGEKHLGKMDVLWDKLSVAEREQIVDEKLRED